MPEIALYVVIAVLSVIVLILLGKLHMLRKTIKEIDEELTAKLDIDTNTQVSISGLDSFARKLAVNINQNLLKLRREKQKYETKNDEIKVAVTNIAHDIRTPLTAANGYLELLSDADLTDEEREWLKVIVEKTDELKGLTEELFSYSTAYSEVENLKLERICLNDEVENAIAGFYGALKSANIEPEIEITETKLYRQLDRKAFLRIVNNLLGNALKYSEGDLTIKLDDTGTLSISNFARNMTAMDVNHLFERFFTVWTAKGSTGLGLSIAKLLTEKMNGKISASLEESLLVIKVEFAE